MCQLSLAACQGGPEAQTSAPPSAAPGQSRPSAPPAAALQVPEAAVASGLTPLPTPQQVVTAQPLGRVDPFLPVPAGRAAGGPALPALPAGFRFNGVIRSGSQAQALVQFGSESGSLRPGDVGGRSTTLLPPGWAVGAIDVNNGRLILRASGRAIALSLDRQG